jgi:hypothetical protein
MMRGKKRRATQAFRTDVNGGTSIGNTLALPIHQHCPRDCRAMPTLDDPSKDRCIQDCFRK